MAENTSTITDDKKKEETRALDFQFLRAVDEYEKLHTHMISLSKELKKTSDKAERHRRFKASVPEWDGSVGKLTR